MLPCVTSVTLRWAVIRPVIHFSDFVIHFRDSVIQFLLYMGTKLVAARIPDYLISLMDARGKRTDVIIEALELLLTEPDESPGGGNGRRAAVGAVSETGAHPIGRAGSSPAPATNFDPLTIPGVHRATVPEILTPGAVSLCRFRSYNGEDGEYYRCGKPAGHGIKHGEWVKE